MKDLYQLFIEKEQNISIDTRNITEGAIFFALKGDNFNGNKYAKKAIEQGAALVVLDEAEYAENSDQYFIVENVLKTLQDLAHYHRKQLKTKVLGITGTNGKTTTKELIASVLMQKYNTLYTLGNLNNHIGVPLTLLRLRESHEIAIIEMGANHVGEIAKLCQIADPDFGLITNIGRAHLEGFGSLEGVITAKSELYNYINQKKGVFFVHSDNAILTKIIDTSKHITYGTKTGNYSAKIVQKTPYISVEWNNERMDTKLIGQYNFENIMAAVCIGTYFKLSQSLVKQGIESYVPSNNRSQLKKTEHNTLLLDAYNANPTSMGAAIDNFIEFEAQTKSLILGDMLELGTESEQEHRNMVKKVSVNSFDYVFLVGGIFSRIMIQNPKIQSFASVDLLIEFLQNKPIQNQTILIKGSRGIKLEKIIDFL